MNLFKRNSIFWAYFMLIASIALFIVSFALKFFPFDKVSVEHRAKELERQLHVQEKDIATVLNDTALLQRLKTGKETQADLELLYDKYYSLYVYRLLDKAQYLKFWSSAHTMLPDSLLDNKNDEQFVRLSNGYYLIKRLYNPEVPGINIYCAILIKSQFFVDTRFFKQSFPLNTKLDKIADISEIPTEYAIKSASGKTYIYLKEAGQITNEYESLIVVVIRLVSFFLIFLSLYFLLYLKVVKKRGKSDISIFLGCMLAFRALLYVFREPFKLGSLELFSPQIFASGFLLPSLGDLLINSLLFCWLGVFIWNRIRSTEHKEILPPIRRNNWLLGVACISLLLGLTFVVIHVIRSIIIDSKISFDVTNFFSLNIYTAVGFLVLAFLVLGYHYFTRILYRYLFPSFAFNVYWLYLLIALVGLMYIALFVPPASIHLSLYCLLWLLLYTFLFNYEKTLNHFIRFNIAGIVVWIFIFSVSLSLLMLSEIKKAELIQRKNYIEKLDTQSDPSTERLMAIASAYLNNDFFQRNFHRFYDENENCYLRDSILSNNYIRYIKNYDGQLYIFDSLNQPLYNPDNISYEALNTILSRQSRPTDVPDLYFYEPEYDRFAYITYRPISDSSGKSLGTVYIISQPKKFSVVSLSPELFRQYRDWEFSNSTVYNYAIYSHKLLVASSKKYPFTSTLVETQIPKAKFELREQDGYSELWYRASKDKVIVMTRKKEVALETITLFSYIFCTFLLLLALIRLTTRLLNFILNKKLPSRIKFSTSIRGQIHNTFILITILSFVVIGVATISFYTKRFEYSNEERLSQTMSIMLNELQSHRELGSLIYEQRIRQDSINSTPLDEIIKRVADIHGVDANIYDFTGRLLATSQPDVYTKGFLSTQIDPRAFFYLFKMRRIEHAQKEKVSNLQYTSMYAPIRSSDGFFNAYLSIPYFTSQQVFNHEMSRFLVTLINLNAFIFLITGLMALLIANRITRSFALIKEKIMQLNLSKNNEMIVWNKNDEIGGLVTEYNRMVVKLRENADALAKSERQEAWREMARQVAHEIKNPLTPMKLSLQYLQRAIDSGSPNVPQLTASVSKTLVEQIDYLSKIAANFSQFANINHANKEIFDLHEVIQSLITIYSKNPDIDFVWKPLPRELNIFADKAQMNRVFTNLFSNANEAKRDDANCQITILEEIVDGKVRISVIDNGVGISEEMKQKIFTPNFTTKSSGTGLGLAMCKGILKQTGGDISFTTEAGKGTTFFLTIPLVDD